MTESTAEPNPINPLGVPEAPHHEPSPLEPLGAPDPAEPAGPEDPDDPDETS